MKKIFFLVLLIASFQIGHSQSRQILNFYFGSSLTFSDMHSEGYSEDPGFYDASIRFGRGYQSKLTSTTSAGIKLTPLPWLEFDFGTAYRIHKTTVLQATYFIMGSAGGVPPSYKTHDVTFKLRTIDFNFGLNFNVNPKSRLQFIPEFNVGFSKPVVESGRYYYSFVSHMYGSSGFKLRYSFLKEDAKHLSLEVGPTFLHSIGKVFVGERQHWAFSYNLSFGLIYHLPGKKKD